MNFQCVIWSRVCGEVGLIGKQINQVLLRFSDDSNCDRMVDEMDRGDSHFIQKQNLREWKKSNHAPSLKHSGILLLNAQRMTLDVSRPRKSSHGQPVSIIPSWNLSCHNVLF